MHGARSGSRQGFSRLAWLLVAVAVLAAACGGEPRKRQPPEYYVVRSGDTLYSIGWRYGLDYKDIARWNGIGRDYRIDVGQRLRLRGPSASATAKSSGARAKKGPATRPPPAVLPAAPPWTWPVQGGRVAGPVRQPSGGVGLRIDGALGQPILAAADGKVVYTGSGLLGYGEVIIVNHARGWLTAYGHNASVLVQEGESVRAGQRIATMGLGTGQQAMLYFEIRIEGSPIDPLSQLPRR
jgi:lipoprotein NlpD